MTEKYADCPACKSGETSWTEQRVKTCQACGHQWDVDSGKTVG